MASGSFARGKEEKNASASMVFVGNINQSVEVILKTSNLFEPFPEAMSRNIDSSTACTTICQAGRFRKCVRS